MDTKPLNNTLDVEFKDELTGIYSFTSNSIKNFEERGNFARPKNKRVNFVSFSDRQISLTVY